MEREEPHTHRRQAALALYALAPTDRHWMLDQLDETQRHDMQALLTELAQLGIPRDARVIDAAISAHAKRSAAEDAIDLAAHPEDVAAVLMREPACVTAACLGALSEGFAGQVLERLPEPRQAAVRQAMQDTPVATPFMRSALIDAVALQLRSLERDQAASKGLA